MCHDENTTQTSSMSLFHNMFICCLSQRGETGPRIDRPSTCAYSSPFLSPNDRRGPSRRLRREDWEFAEPSLGARCQQTKSRACSCISFCSHSKTFRRITGRLQLHYKPHYRRRINARMNTKIATNTAIKDIETVAHLSAGKPEKRQSGDAPPLKLAGTTMTRMVLSTLAEMSNVDDGLNLNAVGGREWAARIFRRGYDR